MRFGASVGATDAPWQLTFEPPVDVTDGTRRKPVQTPLLRQRSGDHRLPSSPSWAHGVLPGLRLARNRTGPEFFGRIRPIALRIGHPARREVAATAASQTRLVRQPRFSRCQAIISPPPVSIQETRISQRTKRYHAAQACGRMTLPSSDSLRRPSICFFYPSPQNREHRKPSNLDDAQVDRLH